MAAPTAEDQTLSPTYRSKLSRAPHVFQDFFPEEEIPETARKTLLDRVSLASNLISVARLLTLIADYGTPQPGRLGISGLSLKI